MSTPSDRRSWDAITQQAQRMHRANRSHANARKMLTDTQTYRDLISAATGAAEAQKIEAWDQAHAQAQRMIQTYGPVTFAFLDDLAYQHSK